MKFNPASSQLYIGDAHNELFILDSTFQLKANIRTPSPPGDIDFTKSGGARLLTIGSIIPSDQKQGQLIPLNKSNTFSKIYLALFTLLQVTSMVIKKKTW
ncbi:MAG: hypothetical protein IPJ13_27930 [Saprospiraceae bacterium]|nr:hypothetical protein [Saprospiraceae bacterium]